MTVVCDIPSVSGSFVWSRWFPLYSRELEGAATQCYQLLQAQPANFSAWGDFYPLDSRCPDVYDLITCIWNRLPAWLQLEFSSAQVLLGLTPTLLSALAPSIGEVSMLSSVRPGLSFLLSLSSPSLFSFRTLEYDDPLDALRIRYQHPSKQSVFAQRHVTAPGRREILISAIEYLVAVGSVANVMSNSWQLGLRTMLIYKAGVLFMVFLWSTFAALVHVVAAVGWHTSNTMIAVRRGHSARLPYLSAAPRAPALRALLGQEFTLCSVMAPQRFLNYARQERGLTLFLNTGASFMGIILLIFGTATFSSLLFIGPLDALSVVVRYLLSAIVARFLIMFELAGLAASEADMTLPEVQPVEQIPLEDQTTVAVK